MSTPSQKVSQIIYNFCRQIDIYTGNKEEGEDFIFYFLYFIVYNTSININIRVKNKKNKGLFFIINHPFCVVVVVIFNIIIILFNTNYNNSQ